MCLFVSHCVTNVHAKGGNGNFKMEFSKTLFIFILLKVLCGWHALTNYTTVNSWSVY